MIGMTRDEAMRVLRDLRVAQCMGAALLYEDDKRRSAIDLAIAALTEPAERQGGEFVLVPRELTEEMFVAFAECWYSKRRAVDDCEMEDCYAAMLAAAPPPPAEVSGEPRDVWKVLSGRQSAAMSRWQEKAVALGYESIEDLLSLALPCVVNNAGNERATPSGAQQLGAAALAQPPAEAGEDNLANPDAQDGQRKIYCTCGRLVALPMPAFKFGATTPVPSERRPDGYAYRYRDAWGSDRTVIAFNRGQELNGCKPIEAIPYYFGTPPKDAPAPSPPVVPERCPARHRAGDLPGPQSPPRWCDLPAGHDGPHKHLAAGKWRELRADLIDPESLATRPLVYGDTDKGKGNG